MRRAVKPGDWVQSSFLDPTSRRAAPQPEAKPPAAVPRPAGPAGTQGVPPAPVGPPATRVAWGVSRAAKPPAASRARVVAAEGPPARRRATPAHPVAARPFEPRARRASQARATARHSLLCVPRRRCIAHAPPVRSVEPQSESEWSESRVSRDALSGRRSGARDPLWFEHGVLRVPRRPRVCDGASRARYGLIRAPRATRAATVRRAREPL